MVEFHSWERGSDCLSLSPGFSTYYCILGQVSPLKLRCTWHGDNDPPFLIPSLEGLNGNVIKTLGAMPGMEAKNTFGREKKDMFTVYPTWYRRLNWTVQAMVFSRVLQLLQNGWEGNASKYLLWRRCIKNSGIPLFWLNGHLIRMWFSLFQGRNSLTCQWDHSSLLTVYCFSLKIHTLAFWLYASLSWV